MKAFAGELASATNRNTRLVYGTMGDIHTKVLSSIYHISTHGWGIRITMYAQYSISTNTTNLDDG